jgi:hypothetical protein
MGLRKKITKELGGVLSFMGRGGSVTLQSSDLRGLGVKQVIKGSMSFDDEIAFNTVIDLGDIPAGATITDITIAALPNDVDPSIRLYGHIGTTEDADLFKDDYLGVNGAAISGLLSEQEVATKVRLTVLDPGFGDPETRSMTGQTLRWAIEYIQE